MAWAGQGGIVPRPPDGRAVHSENSDPAVGQDTGYMVEYAASLGIDCYTTLACFLRLDKEGYAECLKALPAI